MGFKQREVGLKQFRKALEIEPDIKLTKSLVTPELQDAFEEAVLAGNGNKAGGAAGRRRRSGQRRGSAAAGGDENQGGNAAAGGDEGDETSQPRPKPRKKSRDEDEDDKDKDDGRGAEGTTFLGLTIGSSAGVASGNGHMDPAHQLSAPGLRGRAAGTNRAADRLLRELDDAALARRPPPVRDRPQRRERLRPERQHLL